MRLAAHGLGVDLPDGWEGAIVEQPLPAPPPGRTAAAVAAAVRRPTMHLANFPLPAVRGDFGSGAVETMRADHGFVAVIEYGPECADTALFAATSLPRELHVADLSPRGLQRTLPGQAGVQRFATVAGRAVCLYAVVGAHRHAGTSLVGINAVLRTLHVDPA